jgi:hypothetical protein
MAAISSGLVPTAGGHEVAQPVRVKVLFQAPGRGLGLGLQVVAAVDRLAPPPLG